MGSRVKFCQVKWTREGGKLRAETFGAERIYVFQRAGDTNGIVAGDVVKGGASGVVVAVVTAGAAAVVIAGGVAVVTAGAVAVVIAGAVAVVIAGAVAVVIAGGVADLAGGVAVVTAGAVAVVIAGAVAGGAVRAAAEGSGFLLRYRAFTPRDSSRREAGGGEERSLRLRDSWHGLYDSRISKKYNTRKKAVVQFLRTSDGSSPACMRSRTVCEEKRQAAHAASNLHSVPLIQELPHQKQPIISDALLLDLLHRAEELKEGPPEAPPGGWEILAKSQECTAYRRLRQGGTDYEYAVKGHIRDVSAAAYITTLNALPFRLSWDSTGSCKGVPSEVYPIGGSEYEEIIYWRVGLPWPAQDRDFVFARRLRGYKSRKSDGRSNHVHALVCGQVQAEVPEMPPVRDAVRVHTFEAAFIAFPSNDIVAAPLDGEESLSGGAGSERHAPLTDGMGAPSGGNPEKAGVIYVAFHYDKSNSPVPSWLRSYIVAHSLPATMGALRSTALRLVDATGRVKLPGALRGPGGAPLSKQQLKLLEEQYLIHSPQWKGPPGEGRSAGEGGAGDASTVLSPEGNGWRHDLDEQVPIQKHTQQQQHRGAPSCTATGDSGAVLGAVTAAAADLKQLLLQDGRRTKKHAACAAQPLVVPVALGGPHELSLCPPPPIRAAELAELQGLVWEPPWLPPKGFAWRSSAAARSAFLWVLRLRGPPWLLSPCACILRNTQTVSSSLPRIPEKQNPFGGASQAAPCPASVAVGLPCGHVLLRRTASTGAFTTLPYNPNKRR
ncbi:hypothetical protein cyc_07319 [Cyclospora cayetanensis]|uniref:START domain-containing protein n=1 Tax=Cyclospora cayetanensis TaxID=88456 RepID=A0A1D3CTQ8_9EIME|nr:hypothetical protein cyc_07319 [Cyclospora cayetanensis]